MKRSFEIKEEVIDISDDESSKIQPVCKNAKSGEGAAIIFTPSPTPTHQQVLDLQQKVIKLEKDYQGACRYARQFELQLEESRKRVEYLENLLDKKPAAVQNIAKEQVDELQRKLDEESMQLEEVRKGAASSLSSLTQQLIDEKRRGSEDRKKDREIYDSLSALFAKHEREAGYDRMRDRERIDELTYRLAQYERGIHPQMQPHPAVHIPNVFPPRFQEISNHNQIALEENYQRAFQDACQLKLRMENAQLRVTNLENLIAKKQNDGEQLVNELQKKIDELTCKLAQYEGGQQQQHPTQMQLQTLPAICNPPVAPLSHQPTQSPATTQSPTSDATNIFKLCDSDTPQSTPVDNALSLLRGLYHGDRTEWMRKLREIVKDKSIHCNLCNKHPKGHHILEHFLSEKHYKKVSMHQAKKPRDVSISTAAFEYWKRKLESISKPVE